MTKFRVSNQFSEANDMVGFENYRHVCHKWHYKITKVFAQSYEHLHNVLYISLNMNMLFQ